MLAKMRHARYAAHMKRMLPFLLLCLAAMPASAANVPEGWRDYTDAQYGFSIAYPPAFTADTDHDYTALGPGMDIRGVAFMVPSGTASGTNLGRDSYLSVEVFTRGQCSPKLFLADPQNVHAVREGGRSWTVATSTDMGAGNMYDETVYVLDANTPCTAVRYFLHSGNIDNYDNSAVRAFDRGALVATFDQIRRTFSAGPAAR